MYNLDVKCNYWTWVHEIREITKLLHLPGPDAQVEYDDDVVQSAIIAFSRNQWWSKVDET